MTEFENTVAVPCEDLEELKRQAEEINRKIRELSRPKQLAPYVKEKPFDVPRNLKNDEPVFGFQPPLNSEAWLSFMKLAKLIHTKTPQFYMSTAWPGNNRPYIRSTHASVPRTIDQLTREQIQISANMLDEMIAIYNRYMVMLHEKVIYDPGDGSGPRLVDVMPPEDKEVS